MQRSRNLLNPLLTVRNIFLLHQKISMLAILLAILAMPTYGGSERNVYFYFFVFKYLIILESDNLNNIPTKKKQ